MKTYMVTDIKKLCKNRMFLIALGILLFSAIYDPIFMSQTTYKYYQNPFMWWMFMKTGGSTVYYTMFWIFPVLLTGLVYFEERKSALYGILVTKGNRISYFVSKIVSVFGITFVCTICIFLFNLLLVYGFCPDNAQVEEYLIPQYGSYAFSLFQRSPFLMAFVYNILHALTMGLLSTLYLCIHMVFQFKNKHIAILAPVLLMNMIDFAVQATGHMEYSLTILMQPMASMASTKILGIEKLICVFVSIFVSILAGFIIGIRRNRDVL